MKHLLEALFSYIESELRRQIESWIREHVLGLVPRQLRFPSDGVTIDRSDAPALEYRMRPTRELESFVRHRIFEELVDYLKSNQSPSRHLEYEAGYGWRASTERKALKSFVDEPSVKRTAVAYEKPRLANPAALGFAAFALTLFLFSSHNALGGRAVPLLAVFGSAIFYGGLSQFLAGMWEFRTGNVFGATAFSTYGAFWMGVAATVVLILSGKLAATDVTYTLAWILTAFAIFNTYILITSARTQSTAVFLVFLTLEITQILLAWGNFNGNKAGEGLVAVGGWTGIIAALLAWYTSAAIQVNSEVGRSVLPEGWPTWS